MYAGRRLHCPDRPILLLKVSGGSVGFVLRNHLGLAMRLEQLYAWPNGPFKVVLCTSLVNVFTKSALFENTIDIQMFLENTLQRTPEEARASASP